MLNNLQPYPILWLWLFLCPRFFCFFNGPWIFRDIGIDQRVMLKILAIHEFTGMPIDAGNRVLTQYFLKQVKLSCIFINGISDHFSSIPAISEKNHYRKYSKTEVLLKSLFSLNRNSHDDISLAWQLDLSTCQEA